MRYLNHDSELQENSLFCHTHDKVDRPKFWDKCVVIALSIIVLVSALTGCHNATSTSPTGNNSAASSSEIETTIPLPVIPFSYAECLDQPHEKISAILFEAGFENIETQAVEDLFYDEEDRIGTVESVVIDGHNNFSKGDISDKDIPIVIYYHVFRKCNVSIHIDFISNLLFNKYDVEIKMNGTPLGKLKHGEDQDFSFVIDPGNYEFKFAKEDSPSVKGEITLNVTGDTNASYKIYCHSDKIDVDIIYIENLGDIKDGEIMLSSSASAYKYKNYLDVQKDLESMGFTNISTAILYDIVWGWTSEGEVANVSIDGKTDFIRGDIFAMDVPVVITYHMPENADPSTQGESTSAAPEETVSESEPEPTATIEAKIYDIDKDLVVTRCQPVPNKTSMYYVRFSERNASGDYINDYAFESYINPRAMGKNFNSSGALPSWFYIGATVHVQANFGANGLKDCNVSEAASEATLPENPETTVTATSQMPVMPGLTVDTVMTAAKNLGVSIRPFPDENFGKGTLHRELANSSNSINLEFIFNAETEEVLCASIVTYSRISTVQEQKQFVVEIGKTLCPPADSDAVSKWITANVGKEAETTINGFVYHLFLGPSGNICYNAGIQNWEEWDLYSE